MHDLLMMLAGSTFVVIGVLAAAAADRIRGLRSLRAQAIRAVAVPTSRKVVETPTANPGSGEVVEALVAAGFRKAQAAKAVAACTVTEQSSVESWTVAALRHAVS
jgi:Holliday junction resolvasome RuvABC DNA-binding subunit